MIVCKKFWVPGILLSAIALSGCGSIAKGVTEALLEKSEEKDLRACHIKGPASQGLAQILSRQARERQDGAGRRTLKLLMVHGIGRHQPGYSARLTDHLMNELMLNVVEERSKDVFLRSSGDPAEDLGHLRISRFLDKQRNKELLFYELTWSNIIEEEKKALAFDDSKEQTFRRSNINSLMKSFFNSHIPDPLIYLGNSRSKIINSVRQASCWMTSVGWEDLEVQNSGYCDVTNLQRFVTSEDEIVYVTHSLGSRIVIDAMQFSIEEIAKRKDPIFLKARAKFQKRGFAIYMLANQLPLLQLGRDPAAVSGRIEEYCNAGGERASDRLLGRLNIFAFSDPNDILSYTIPPRYADEYMDSRMCPKITNIVLNVAKPVKLFGIGEIANPVTAHNGYEQDDRVIAIIANGFGHADSKQIVKERCDWLETVPASPSS